MTDLALFDLGAIGIVLGLAVLFTLVVVALTGD